MPAWLTTRAAEARRHVAVRAVAQERRVSSVFPRELAVWERIGIAGCVTVALLAIGIPAWLA